MEGDTKMTHSQLKMGLLMMVMVTLVTQTMAGVTSTGLVVVRETEAGDRVKRAVGPVAPGADINNDIGGQQQRKYRRLEHSIMVQADIRSRSDDRR